jgi:hypothetical protein
MLLYFLSCRFCLSYSFSDVSICPRVFIVVKIEILANIIFNVCKSTIKSNDILIFIVFLCFIFL